MGEFSGARTGESVEQRLARLEDVEAIMNLKERYAHYCDNGYDAEGVGSLFAEDGSWESNKFGSYQGREAVKGFIRDVASQILWATHYMIAPKITVAEDGQSATGTWYLLELATMTAADGSQSRDAVIMCGNYVDTFVKRDGEWKFKDVRLHFHNVSNLDQGWVRQQYRG